MQVKTRSVPVTLDLNRYELRRSGQRINLERIPMELLILLARSGGRLLTRKEIIDHLWGKNPWLDADRNLNTAIGKIRRALGDDPDAPRFIETAVGRGYRFIAPVRSSQEANEMSADGGLELVILDSSSQHTAQEVDDKPAIRLMETLHEIPPDLSCEKLQTTGKIFAFGGWAAAGVLFLSLCVFGWMMLDRHGWIIHQGDTPVWIRSEWLVGEYRRCQMRTQEQERLGRHGELPRLFCGEDENGFLEFQAETASVAAVPAAPDIGSSSTGGAHLPGVTVHPDHNFHVMPVRYFGRTERPDKAIISWRCRRNSDSLTCHALD